MCCILNVAPAYGHFWHWQPHYHGRASPGASRAAKTARQSEQTRGGNLILRHVVFHQLIGGLIVVVYYSRPSRHIWKENPGILFIEPGDAPNWPVAQSWFSWMPRRIRHPPVARVDMATVGTSMSDGQCHEVGHQVWCEEWWNARNPLVVLLWEAEAIAAIAEMAAEGTKRVVVPISRMGASAAKGDGKSELCVVNFILDSWAKFERMNGAIVITETWSIVDGVMMEDKVCKDLEFF